LRDIDRLCKGNYMENVPTILYHRRTPDERAELSRMIEALSGEGYTQAEIAEEMNVSVGTVNKYIQPFFKRLNDETCADIDAMVENELSAIKNLQRSYWNAWEASTKKGPGNPRYMKGMERCLDLTCEIFGLYKQRSRTTLTMG